MPSPDSRVESRCYLLIGQAPKNICHSLWSSFSFSNVVCDINSFCSDVETPFLWYRYPGVWSKRFKKYLCAFYPKFISLCLISSSRSILPYIYVSLISSKLQTFGLADHLFLCLILNISDPSLFFLLSLVFNRSKCEQSSGQHTTLLGSIFSW